MVSLRISRVRPTAARVVVSEIMRLICLSPHDENSRWPVFLNSGPCFRIGSFRQLLSVEQVTVAIKAGAKSRRSEAVLDTAEKAFANAACGRSPPADSAPNFNEPNAGVGTMERGLRLYPHAPKSVLASLPSPEDKVSENRSN